MDISTTSLASQYASIYGDTVSTSLTSATSLDTTTATDEEMLDACKEFEQYFVEQMIKEVKKTIPDDELLGDNDYMNMFEDTYVQEIAEQITDSGQLGLAQQLYESMQTQAGATIK
jgi:flagellar protein FlgJ